MDTAIFEKYGLKPLEPLLETEQITMWKMTQPAINRTVLVHVLGTALTSDPHAVSYLFSVVRSISNTSAPAVSQIYTIFDEPDFKAVVAEYVDGLSLEQTVSALGPLSMKQTVRTGLAVAEALKDVWDASHIIYGSVRPEFVTLDAGSTAKLISPCYAQVAPADVQVPESDMQDLGHLLYFLATGVRPGEAHSVNLPREFTAFLEKLSSENPVTRFASWDSVIESLKSLENLRPAAAAAAGGSAEGGAKRPGVKRSFGAPAGKVPKAVKREGPARSAAIASRLAIEKPEETEETRALAASRKAAQARAMAEERRSSGAGAKLFACIALVVILGTVFVLRIGLVEFERRMERLNDVSIGNAAPGSGAAPAIAVDDTPVPPEPAKPSLRPAVPPPETERPSAVEAQPAPEPVAPSVPEPVARKVDDAAVNRYLAAHVGGEVPFLHKGVEHKVTLVSYTATTVTVRTRKTLTLKRSDLSPEQLELWK